MMGLLKRLLGVNSGELNRAVWLERTLSELPDKGKILDVGAGELRNRKFCAHLDYVSQDFCQYTGEMPEGLQISNWDTSRIDIVSDLLDIPVDDASFDAVLCSEVLEHVPEPTKALDEFRRILRPGGMLILTAPFASLVHFAPYHFATGFSKYWYEHHLKKRAFEIVELVPNGDWFDYFRQHLIRSGQMARKYSDPLWPLAYAYGLLGALYYSLSIRKRATDLACMGWMCMARKSNPEFDANR